MILLVFLIPFVLGFLVMFLVGLWENRGRPDYDHIDRLERKMGIGPPYSSEFPRYRPRRKKDQIW